MDKITKLMSVVFITSTMPLLPVSVAEFFGWLQSKSKAGFDKSRAVFGRQETFKIGDKSCTLILIKNPVGASSSR